MNLALNYTTDTSDIKSQTSEGQIGLVLGYNGQPFDLHNVSDKQVIVKIGNIQGYIQDITVNISQYDDVTLYEGKIAIPLSDDNIQNLPPDVYYLEAWVNVPTENNDGTQDNDITNRLIFPSSHYLPFTITSNMVNGSNSMPMIKFDAVKQDWENFKQFVLQHEAEVEGIINQFHSDTGTLANSVTDEINQYYSFASSANYSMNNIDSHISSASNTVNDIANNAFNSVNSNVNSGENTINNVTNNAIGSANSALNNIISEVSNADSTVNSGEIAINAIVNSGDNNISNAINNIDSKVSSADTYISNDVNNINSEANSAYSGIRNSANSVDNNIANSSYSVNENISSEANSAYIHINSSANSGYNGINSSANSVYAKMSLNQNNNISTADNFFSSAYGQIPSYMNQYSSAMITSVTSNMSRLDNAIVNQLDTHDELLNRRFNSNTNMLKRINNEFSNVSNIAQNANTAMTIQSSMATSTSSALSNNTRLMFLAINQIATENEVLKSRLFK